MSAANLNLSQILQRHVHPRLLHVFHRLLQLLNRSQLSSNTSMRSVLSDVLTIENGTESKKALSSLFSQLLEDEDEKRLKSFCTRAVVAVRRKAIETAFPVSMMVRSETTDCIVLNWMLCQNMKMDLTT